MMAEKILVKKIPKSQEVFLLDAGYNLNSEYVISAIVEAIEYKIVKSQPVIVGYKISNPRILFSKKFWLNSSGAITELNERFSDAKIQKFLNDMDLQKSRKNDAIIDLPKGSYRMLFWHKAELDVGSNHKNISSK